jgi:hypothetical protein
VTAQPAPVLVVDAANVIGSRPTGWWRDRAAAARTFVATVSRAVAGGHVTPPVVVVLEGAARRGAPAGLHGRGVDVVHASGAGDDAIVAAVTAATAPVRVVTADRALRTRVARLGADVVGPGWLLDRLDALEGGDGPSG